MAWNSAYLGSNIMSSYLHIDNLRRDLVTGKFWDASGTKYLQVSHDGTSAKLDASGNSDLRVSASGFRVTSNILSNYVDITPGASGVSLAPFSGAMMLQGSSLQFATVGGGTCQLAHDGTNTTLKDSYVPATCLKIMHQTGVPAATSIALWDATKAAYWKLTIDNGAVVVGAL